MTTFETELDAFKNIRTGGLLTDTELAVLCMAAKEDGRDAHPAAWARFRYLLDEHTNLDAKGKKATYKECKIVSEIGTYPHSVRDLIKPWLASRRYRMKFSGEFGNSHDAEYILNDLTIWNGEVLGTGPLFPKDFLRPAFVNWMSQEQDRMVRAAYQTVRFDPNASKEELTRFAMLITSPCDDEDQWARNIRATEIALENFIYRVKNHMRGRWHHGIHMMPVLYGPQGSGKTTAVRHLLSPLDEFSSAVGFDIFDHDGKMYKLSQTPIMFFDEMAGISKAENERLKDIMHTQSRELRRLYGNPATRTLVSTFIGCTNKDISTLIKDETGNRRYLQIDTPRLRREDIQGFDALVMWRSVDEDGEPPLYAKAEDLKIIQDVQSEQRHRGPVELWIDSVSVTDWFKASEAFTNQFVSWVRDHLPGQDRFQSDQAFGKELNRLLREGHPRLQTKKGKNGGNLYRITETGKVVEFPRPVANHEVMGPMDGDGNFPTTPVVSKGPPPAMSKAQVNPVLAEDHDRLARAMATARARKDMF